MMLSTVVYQRDIPYTQLDSHVKRRVLAYNDAMMMVEVCFETGGVGSPHTHPHAQSTYVQSGRFRFTIDGRDAEVAAGDTIAFAPGVTHGTVCLEAGTLIDVFAPMREDFL